MAAAKNAKRREKTINDLKSFAGGFKLVTPIPKDIAKICKLDEGNKQNRVNYVVKENGVETGEKGVERQL